MRVSRLWLITLAAIASGCVLSVEAVVSDSTSTFDPRLLGNWMGASDSSDRATISRESGNLYEIAYTDDDKTARFQGRLGRLGSRTVLDVWPVPSDTDVAEPYRGLLIPGHTLLAIDIFADSLRTQTVRADSLRAALRSGRLRLDTLTYDRELILMGSTNVLRMALSAYIGRPNVLDDPGVWKRVR